MIRINKVKTTKGKTGFSRKTIKKVFPPDVSGENNNLSKTNISSNLNNSNKQNHIIAPIIIYLHPLVYF